MFILFTIITSSWIRELVWIILWKMRNIPPNWGRVSDIKILLQVAYSEQNLSEKRQIWDFERFFFSPLSNLLNVKSIKKLLVLLGWSFIASLNHKVAIWWGFFRLTAPAMCRGMLAVACRPLHAGTRCVSADRLKPYDLARL